MPHQASPTGCPFLTDPARIFDDLAAVRTSGDLPWSDALGTRVVTRYDDIVEALHDPGRFSSRPTVPDLPLPWREQFAGRVPDRGTLIGVDNPDHDRLRASVNTFFMPRRLRRYEPWIREQAHRLVDTFAVEGACDLKARFALPLPLKVISHVVGMAPDRSEWVGEALGFFLGPKDPHPGTPEEKARRLLDLHDQLRELMEERRTDRRDDLISHIWDQRDAGVVEMSDFEMLSMFPGLMLAGHETTSNLLCMALSHLLPDGDRYAAAQRDDRTRAAALEELFRFESAITGMRREVTEDTVLGGVRLRAGEQVFLAYAAGSRDPRHFGRPDEIDPTRGWSVPHLGFGQGVHACLGAPLARLLLNVELSVLHERLPDLAIADQAVAEARNDVAEGRGMASFLVRWTPAPRRRPASESATEVPRADVRRATVVARRLVTPSVVELTFEADGFPEWEPGAHVNLHLPGGLVRQYSLCGPVEAGSLRIGVLRESGGRGGSAAAHALAVGDVVDVGAPRNQFRLRTAPTLLLVAGGIGITPLLSMVDAAERAGVDWQLLQLGRTLSGMPYADDLVARHPDRVRLWPSVDRGRYDLDRIWADVGDGLVYACGPESLLVALEESARTHGTEEQLVLERFAPRRVDHGPARPFEVHLARQDVTLTVAAHESLLDVVNKAGSTVLSTCREGTCGTCEVPVLAGQAEHRDSVLSAEERLAGDTIMTCVSRCRGSRLVLDL
jgi:cytochrome P450/ferredoxin-NADP reductase